VKELSVIVLNRIDNRLIHGQVIEAWLPHLRVRRLVVADDAVALDDLAQAAMALAVPADVEVHMTSLANIDWKALEHDGLATLVLFREVRDAVAARELGLPDGILNVGNVHAGPGRVSISRSVFLNTQETRALQALGQDGMQVVIQAVPNEKPAHLPV
jgi:mannose/fructose/N-acetylgalactosamine-specific phosphotransferase system component IIB